MQATDSTDILWDAVIAGGGLAGLALASELASPEFAHLRVRLIEPRTHYTRDRTWSYWRRADERHAFVDAECAQWTRWRVACNSEEIVHSTPGTVYASIRSNAFYSLALERIRAASHITMSLGTGVTQIANGEPATVTLMDGTAIRATHVFDARPPAALERAPLAQHFAGWDIECERDAFDASVVDLMHFQPNANGVHFLYVLPTDKRHALVESTWISAATHAPHYEEEIKHYLAQRFALTDYHISYRESARLPLMNLVVPDTPSAITPIGTAAGTARASTGYAFMETLRDCARIAAALRNGEPITPFRRAAADRFMDTTFLHCLAHRPMLAPSLFMALFSRCDPASLIRFLSGTAGWKDRLAVVRSLPVAPLLGSAIGVLAGRSPHPATR